MSSVGEDDHAVGRAPAKVLLHEQELYTELDEVRRVEAAGAWLVLDRDHRAVVQPHQLIGARRQAEAFGAECRYTEVGIVRHQQV